MSTDENVLHLSEAEITEIIHGLSTKDLARMRRIAAMLSRFSPISADDLAQEALFRALEGSRRCPRGLPPVPFLAGVMRSVASDAAKARRRHPQHSIELMNEAGHQFADDAGMTEDGHIAQEEEAALLQRASSLKERIIGLFQDDLAAQVIVEGLIEGVEGEELRDLTGLDKTAFASKRRLVRRRITKAIGEKAN